MDTIRYYLALILVMSYPPAFGLWFMVHPFIGFWRRIGVGATFTVSTLVFAAVCYAIFRGRDTLLAVQYGTNWFLVGFGVLLYGLGAIVEKQCRKQLTLRTLVGIPELKAPQEGPGSLLEEGIYARVRHPRYLGVMLGGTAVAMITNYLAAYLLMLALIPVVYALTAVEEKELRERFGDDHRRYCERVPRIIPRLG